MFVTLVLVAVLVGLAWVLYKALKPETAGAGGSIDLFIKPDTVQPRARAVDRYRRTYSSPGRQVLIAYGTEYGFTCDVARSLYDALEADGVHGWQPRLLNLKDYALIDWTRETVVLAAMSTAGDGIPPSEAQPALASLANYAGNLSHLHVAVLALGDQAYPHFCRAGKQLHSLLQSKASHELVPLQLIDGEDWPAIRAWTKNVCDALATLAPALDVRLDYLDMNVATVGASGPDRHRPFQAPVLVRRQLTATSDERAVWHLELDLSGSGITYEPGDALGVVPTNAPADVAAVLRLLDPAAIHTFTIAPPLAAETDGPLAAPVPLPTLLAAHCDLKVVRPELLDLLATHASGAERDRLVALLAGGLTVKTNGELAEYLYGRELVDVLRDFGAAVARTPVRDLLGCLRPLQPRYYSIASAPGAFRPDGCALTVAEVRYELHDTPRTGVASVYLAERVQLPSTVPVFLSRNPHFRLPKDPAIPILMIGPGTGLAPFRAFIEERMRHPDAGAMTLYFGCRHRAVDYLYHDELEGLASAGRLRLRVAFSRDQPAKVYVQHLLKEDAAHVWSLLQAGGHVYVCGDATRMASDVHAALCDVVALRGNLSSEAAAAFWEQLASAERYQRDVWAV